MKGIAAYSPIRLLSLLVATSLLPPVSIGENTAAAQDSAANHPTGDSAAVQDKTERIRAQCNVDDAEIDPKKVNKQNACVERYTKPLKQKLNTLNKLQSTVRALDTQAQPPPSTQFDAGGRVLRQNTKKIPPPSASQTGQAGGSVGNTPSTCGDGAAATDNALIRVHRVLMAPKNASDDFGYRLGKRYLVYQVTISNDNKDYQYLLHDVTVDLTPFFVRPPSDTKARLQPDYKYSASSQDLTLLRGIPEKGQDLDRRNLILHVLTGIGSVAGAVSGLTAFSDVMGSSVAVFNGSFLQGYSGIAPDHTGTQLNRLSDSAYIANTLVDKQRAKTIAIFIPEALIMSRADQKGYWKDPQVFLAGTNHGFNQADVCVDGAFITTVASLTLTKAVLIPKPLTAQLTASGPATLIVQGTNLSTNDTQVVGLGTTVTLTSSNGTTGTVDVTLPSNYTSGMTVHLASAANSSIVSSTIATTTMSQPTLSAATLAPVTGGAPLGQNIQATLTVTGTNLVQGDTQVIMGSTTTALTTVSADGKTGTVVLNLPSDYRAPGISVFLTSALVTPYVPAFKSTPNVTTTESSAVVVSVSPQTAMLTAGQTQQLTATVTGTSNQQVSWSISPTGVGSVSATGLYTAPASVTAQMVVVTATSAADSSKTGSATIALH